MNAAGRIDESASLNGVGSYTVREASRLIGVPPLSITRWLKGYQFRSNGKTLHSPPLWQPRWPSDGEHQFELGFRDLIELRFVKAFTDAGVGLLAIRNCLDFARKLVEDDHPFATRRFRTDGKTIFLESSRANGDDLQMLDLKQKQYAFARVIDRTFKDLDLDDDVVARWRPFDGRESIVVDPERSFGQPIAAAAGVPTIVLAEAVEAEGAEDRVAKLFELPISVVRDAVRFEARLGAR